jgi:hypothetical protein
MSMKKLGVVAALVRGVAMTGDPTQQYLTFNIGIASN